MGHEFTAIIETIGGDIKGFEVGQRIVMATSVSCGRCYYCSKGHGNLCLSLSPMAQAHELVMHRRIFSDAGDFIADLYAKLDSRNTEPAGGPEPAAEPATGSTAEPRACPRLAPRPASDPRPAGDGADL